ncbi:ATP-binding protein [Methanobrevibacter sp. DSM 116169]|uniref:ATP-binding protein n=1 Tax=Methanobrevibacter sp. DSM 116169 TaxID=3242727 RepID=UPI0038FD3593
MVLEETLTDYIFAKQREISLLAKNNLKENDKAFNHRFEYDRIKNRVDNYLESSNQNRFIIMPGLRGVGKTTILLQIYEYLISQKNIPNSNILYLDINELNNFFKGDIYSCIETFLKDMHQTTLVDLDKKIFLLIDEAHFDKSWALAGKLIYDKSKNIFMIFTGSSALDLELNVDTVRRVVKEPIFPCNFPEYLLLKYDLNSPKISEELKNLILKGTDLEITINKENEIKKSLFDLNNDPNIELEKFLFSYGFPFALDLEDYEIHKKTVEITNRIVEKDIPSIKNFNTSTNTVISNIITYLALQKPGATSNIKLSQILGVSPKSVNDILNVLEKTQLIFPITPYGTGSKIVKKPWQYFFLSPSIKASINYEIGRYDIANKKCLGALAETLVISSLYKLKLISNNSLGLFYDANKGGVDFLIKNLDKIIPIEVGIGKKTKSQLTKAINNYDSDYGILISNRKSNISFEDDILHIPLLTFSYL